jgi:hypothetical protein
MIVTSDLVCRLFKSTPCRLVALNARMAAPKPRPLSGAESTLRGRGQTDVIDPEQTSRFALKLTAMRANERSNSTGLSLM